MGRYLLEAILDDIPRAIFFKQSLEIFFQKIVMLVAILTHFLGLDVTKWNFCVSDIQ